MTSAIHGKTGPVSARGLARRSATVAHGLSGRVHVRPQPWRDLDHWRETRFVGRAAELEALERLSSPSARSRLAYVHGIGGIGKTELLRAFARRARERGWRVRRLDARELPSSPGALRAALGGSEEQGERIVTLLDSFDQLYLDDQSFWTEVLPELPRRTRLVLAGRNRLSAAWSLDTIGVGRLRLLELGELSPDDARLYLRRRNISGDVADSVVAAAGGFPLALALAADAAKERRLENSADLETDHRLAESLLQRVLDRPPSRAHHRALMLSAVVAETTEDMVACIVDGNRAGELFRWLGSRSYIRRDRQRVAPHESIRPALLASLRGNDVELYYELLLDAGRYYQRQLGQGGTLSADLSSSVGFLFALSERGPRVTEDRDKERPEKGLRRKLSEWLESTAARAPAGVVGPNLPAASTIRAQLKQALKQADRPDRLCSSPLLELQAVRTRTAAAAGELEQARALVELLQELARMFLQTPRDEIYFDVLNRTYFDPAVKQRVAAEELHLSFGTYRRYLGTAIERLAEALCRHERAVVLGAAR